MLNPSTHYKKFAKFPAELRKTFQLFGEQILIQELEKPEVKSKGGIVLSSDARQRDSFEQDRPFLAQVLMLGEGYYNSETKETTELDSSIGNVVLLAPGSVRILSQVGPLIGTNGSRFGITLERNVNIRWASVEDYNQFYKELDRDDD